MKGLKGARVDLFLLSALVLQVVEVAHGGSAEDHLYLVYQELGNCFGALVFGTRAARGRAKMFLENNCCHWRSGRKVAAKF